MEDPEPSNFDATSQDADERALRQADADVGRVVPHAEVVRWLRSWGTADELPAPYSANASKPGFSP